METKDQNRLDSLEILSPEDLQQALDQLAHDEEPTGKPDNHKDCPNCH